MEILFEALFELIFEGAIEASINKKVPKPIRYILSILLALFFITAIALIIWMGIDCLKKNIIGGLLIISFGLLLLVLGIIKLNKRIKSKE